MDGTTIGYVKESLRKTKGKPNSKSIPKENMCVLIKFINLYSTKSP